MLRNTFNQLLDKHFAVPVKYSKLNNLERDVMGHIKLLKLENSEKWYEKIISVFSIPQFRVASIAVALFVGIGTSPMLEPSNYMEINTFTLNAFSYENSPLSLHLK